MKLKNKFKNKTKNQILSHASHVIGDFNLLKVQDGYFKTR